MKWKKINLMHWMSTLNLRTSCKDCYSLKKISISSLVKHIIFDLFGSVNNCFDLRERSQKAVDIREFVVPPSPRWVLFLGNRWDGTSKWLRTYLWIRRSIKLWWIPVRKRIRDYGVMTEYINHWKGEKKWKIQSNSRLEE